MPSVSLYKACCQCLSDAVGMFLVTNIARLCSKQLLTVTVGLSSSLKDKLCRDESYVDFTMSVEEAHRGRPQTGVCLLKFDHNCSTS